MPYAFPSRRNTDGSRRDDDHAPDYVHWKRFDSWHVKAATCLLLDIDPDGSLGQAIARAWDGYPLEARSRLTGWQQTLLDEAMRIRDYTEDAARSRPAGALFVRNFSVVNSRHWLQWARDKGIEPPLQIAEMIVDQPSREDLQREIQRQATAIQELQVRLQSKWPWGPYETRLLRELRAAVEKWWVNFDPSDPTSAPTNKEVEEWLKDREVPVRVREIVAQIIRADGLRPGPRK